MLKELNETTIKEPKECLMTMLHQINNMNKQKLFSKTQKEIL